MSIYIVTYDLNKQKNYPALFEAIMSAGTDYCHAQDSVWFLESSAGSQAIRDYILLSTDSDDTLFVGQVTSESAWVIPESASNWLMAKL